MPTSPHAPGQHSSVPGGNSTRKSFPHQERNELPAFSAFWNTEQSTLFLYLTQLHLTQRPTKLGTGRRAGDTKISHVVQVPVKYSTDKPSTFHHWRNQQPVQPPQTPADFTAFQTIGFSCLLYAASITLTPKPDKYTPGKLQANHPNECKCKNSQQNTSKMNLTAY